MRDHDIQMMVLNDENKGIFGAQHVASIHPSSLLETAKFFDCILYKKYIFACSIGLASFLLVWTPDFSFLGINF